MRPLRHTAELSMHCFVETGLIQIVLPSRTGDFFVIIAVLSLLGKVTGLLRYDWYEKFC
jgi:hypothetical protein